MAGMDTRHGLAQRAVGRYDPQCQTFSSSPLLARRPHLASGVYPACGRIALGDAAWQHAGRIRPVSCPSTRSVVLCVTDGDSGSRLSRQHINGSLGVSSLSNRAERGELATRFYHLWVITSVLCFTLV